MAEYWKSTPKYWCKFCEIYVRDTGIERKNHESTAKHQGNIQRSLRGLHKDQERQQREQQRAKDEVARLNGLVGGNATKPTTTSTASKPPVKSQAPALAPPQLNPAAQRKAQAEKLVSLGVELPPELKEELSGVGGWKTVSERVVHSSHDEHGRATTSQPKSEGEGQYDGLSKGVHKRKAEDMDEDDEALQEEQISKPRKAWGTTLKRYPDANGEPADQEDLDALLTGIKKKAKVPTIKHEDHDHSKDNTRAHGQAHEDDMKPDPGGSDKAELQTGEASTTDLKQEEPDSAITAPPVVVFKKRKAKK